MNFYLKSVLALSISMVIVFIAMPFVIKALKAHQLNQSVSEYALSEFKNKEKTPIMGGLVFIVAALITFCLVHPIGLINKKVLFVICNVFLYCFVGFLDDIFIILKKDNDGLSPRTKLIMEIIFSIALFVIFKDVLTPKYLSIPLIDVNIPISIFVFLPLLILLFTAEANAVNFTDGMDGLCAGVSCIGLIPFVLFASDSGDFDFVYLILCFIGGLIAYLYFNFKPAKIFMGDSGSLALGALFSSLAIVLDKEIVLFVVGGVFVVEMFCVCVQLLSVKLFHKRVFSYTPIHYAFTLSGKKEINVVSMFYLFAIICSVLGSILGLVHV